MYTLLEALGLVVIVVFIFLQGWRATLIPLLAVPVSLIGTFIIFPALGFSINTLSLFGLVLAIGLVVDDAIIVVEAVEHHIDEGMDPKSATEKAMEEVGGPVVAIALILAAVFIPTAAIPGITGRMYQQFAVTIAISVLISAFNALTLSPALASLLLKPREEGRKKGLLGRGFALFNKFFRRNTDAFVGTSRVLIHKSCFAMIGLVLVGVVAVYLGSSLPGGFIPTEDQGYMFLALQLPDGASAQRTDAAQQKITRCTAQDARHRRRHRRHRLLASHAGAEHKRRILLRQSQAVGCAQEQRGAARIHSEQSAEAARRQSGWHRLCISAAFHSGHRNLRRRHHDP